jgi:Lon protease-like protein
MSINRPYAGAGELPGTIPIFPLAGALLLPRGEMPLNIFEPRYLALVDDALKGHRLIGMIQPLPDAAEGATAPPLFTVGCLGRITQFAESGDGRVFVALTGVARFRVRSEVLAMTPYRQCAVDYEPFASDFVPRAGEDEVDRKAVIAALRLFAKSTNQEVDWKSINQAPNEALVNALSIMSPFGPKEKQALLEAGDLKTRADVLVAITEIELARGGADGSTLQ